MMVLLAICFLVGTLIGITGIGGILLIPSLAVFGGLETHAAMATALASFLAGGVVGTYRYWRMGYMHWRTAFPVAAGGLLFAYVGAWVNAGLPVRPLDTMLGLLIIFAGVSAFKSWTAGSFCAVGHRLEMPVLLFIGASTGFLAGLTGAGGPVLSIPFMIVAGFAPVLSVAVAMPYQIMTAFSGTVGNLLHGTVDFGLIVPITIVQVLGVYLGSRLAPHIPAARLKTMIGLVCLGVGGFVLVRAWL